MADLPTMHFLVTGKKKDIETMSPGPMKTALEVLSAPKDKNTKQLINDFTRGNFENEQGFIEPGNENNIKDFFGSLDDNERRQKLSYLHQGLSGIALNLTNSFFSVDLPSATIISKGEGEKFKKQKTLKFEEGITGRFINENVPLTYSRVGSNYGSEGRLPIYAIVPSNYIDYFLMLNKKREWVLIPTIEIHSDIATFAKENGYIPFAETTYKANINLANVNSSEISFQVSVSALSPGLQYTGPSPEAVSGFSIIKTEGTTSSVELNHEFEDRLKTLNTELKKKSDEQGILREQTEKTSPKSKGMLHLLKTIERHLGQKENEPPNLGGGKPSPK